jgi:hypothetical protein
VLGLEGLVQTRGLCASEVFVVLFVEGGDEGSRLPVVGGGLHDIYG